jgi:hypothetical protein
MPPTEKRFFAAKDCAKVLGMTVRDFLEFVRLGKFPRGRVRKKRMLWSAMDIKVMVWLEEGNRERMEPITNDDEIDKLDELADEE